MYKISQQCRCCIGHSYGMLWDSLPTVLAHLPAALQPTSTLSLRSFLILGTKAVLSSQACSVIPVSTVATTFVSGVLVLARPCFIGVCC